jgi:hypothetical protein
MRRNRGISRMTKKSRSNTWGGDTIDSNVRTIPIVETR